MMVTMKNIREENIRILVDCYKEGIESEYFTLVLDSQTYEVISCSLEKPSIYTRQAVCKIIELHRQQKHLPTEACSVWC